MKQPRNRLWTRSTYSRRWFRVGINSASQEGLLSFEPSFLEIPKLEDSGRRVSGLYMNYRNKCHFFAMSLTASSSFFSRCAVWMLGNLARATYVGSSDYVWPYSYNQCDPKKRMAQEINACQKVSHYGMDPGLGRGAPEIDVIEAMQGDPEKLPNTNITRPYQSCSLQVCHDKTQHYVILSVSFTF